LAAGAYDNQATFKVDDEEERRQRIHQEHLEPVVPHQHEIEVRSPIQEDLTEDTHQILKDPNIQNIEEFEVQEANQKPMQQLS